MNYPFAPALMSVKCIENKWIKKIRNQKRKGEMTTLPLTLSGSSTSKTDRIGRIGSGRHLGRLRRRRRIWPRGLGRRCGRCFRGGPQGRTRGGSRASSRPRAGRRRCLVRGSPAASGHGSRLRPPARRSSLPSKAQGRPPLFFWARTGGAWRCRTAWTLPRSPTCCCISWASSWHCGRMQRSLGILLFTPWTENIQNSISVTYKSPNIRSDQYACGKERIFNSLFYICFILLSYCH